MPRKKTVRRKTRRRRNIVRRRRRKFPLLGNMPMPKRFATRLRYAFYNIQINPAADDPVEYYFSANSPYHPDNGVAIGTGDSHQPMGWDQLIQFYRYCTCVSSKMVCNFFPSGTAVTDQSYAGILVHSDNSAAYSVTRHLESPDSSIRIINAADGRSKTVSKTWSAKKWSSYKNPVGHDQLRCSITGNPADQIFFIIFVSPVNSSDNVSTVYISGYIEYFCVFTEREVLAQS